MGFDAFSGPNLIVPSSGIVATSTNDDASPGKLGYYTSTTVLLGSAVSLSSASPANITNLPLSAGDWEVWGTIDTNTGGSTDVTQVAGWISTVSATLPTPPNNGAIVILNYSSGSHIGLNDHYPVGMMRLSLAAATTVYLGMRMLFAVSTAAGYGFIGARTPR